MKKSLFHQVLTNRWVLYIVLAMFVYKTIGFLCMNEFINILILVVSASITRMFTKNMIIVLGVPLVLSLMRRVVFQESFTDSENAGDGNVKSSKKAVSDDMPILPVDETPGETESTPEDVPGSDAGKGEGYRNKINYATTLADSMKTYSDILGQDGFSKMTTDTKELLKQQDRLGKSIREFAPMVEQLTPFLTQATGILSKLDTGHIKNISNAIKKI